MTPIQVINAEGTSGRVIHAHIEFTSGRYRSYVSYTKDRVTQADVLSEESYEDLFESLVRKWTEGLDALGDTLIFIDNPEGEELLSTEAQKSKLVEMDLAGVELRLYGEPV